MTQLPYPPLVLSLFPGIDMFGRAFECEGFSVVRGPDPIFGGDIREFFPPHGHFHGIIGGSPCQDFSKARRCAPTGYGVAMLREFLRVTHLAAPNWFVLENVPGVPDVRLDGYVVQRLNLTAADVGLAQNRNRCFQFGSRDGVGLVVPRSDAAIGNVERCVTATEGSRASRRTWSEFVQLQGLPATFDIPSFSRSQKYRAVGNGVPIPMGRAIARAVQSRHYFQALPVCACNCGRPVTGKQVAASAACRKRMERQRRDSAGVTGPGVVTLEASLCPAGGATPQRGHAAGGSQT